MKMPNFEVINAKWNAVTIRDIGPWSQYPTITNAADEVVKELWRRSLIRDGVRLFYYDSDAEFGELLHHDGRFKGFKSAVPQEAYK